MVWRRRFSAVLVAATLVCAACSIVPSPAAPPLSMQAGSIAPPAPLAYRPPITVDFEPDDTGSYPKSDFTAATHLLADWLDVAVRSNQGGVVVYVTLITSHTYRPDSTVMTLVIPSTPPDPQPPALAPLPRPTGDPFTDAQARAKAQATNGVLLQQYQAALKQQAALIDRVRVQVKTQTDRLRQLDLGTDNTATSIWGGIQSASDRLSNVTGQRWLIVASDMENNSLADYTHTYPLRGVHVAVLFYYCTVAPECQSKTAFWRQVFLRAGAADVRFADPATSEVLPDLFDGGPA